MVFLVAIPQGLRDCLHWEPAVTWTALAARAAGSTSGGVLQGDFAPRADWPYTIRRWRHLIVMTIVLLAGHGALLGWQHHRIQQQIEQVDSQMHALWQAVQPGSRVVNVQVQLRQKLLERQRMAGPSFSRLFYALVERLQTQPDASIRDINFDYQAGRLQASVYLPDMPALEALLAPSNSKFKLQLNSSSAQPQGLQASVIFMEIGH